MPRHWQGTKVNIKYMWSDRRYLIYRRLDSLKWWIAGKVPNGIKMRVFMLMIGRATTGEYDNTVVPELTAMEAIKRWEQVVGFKD